MSASFFVVLAVGAALTLGPHYPDPSPDSHSQSPWPTDVPATLPLF